MAGTKEMKTCQLHTIMAALALMCCSCLVLTVRPEVIGESKLVYQWTTLNFDWPSDAQRTEALKNGTFIPERNILAGIKIYKNTVYLTIPRWRWTSGHPVTLAKVVEIEGEVKLRPYPNWAAQRQGDCQALQYVQSMEIDPNTGLMYVIDTGRVGIEGSATALDLCPAKIVIYDLNTDTQVGSYEMPADIVTRNGNFMNDIVLDYVLGTVRYAYISDVREGRMHIYDFQAQAAYNLEDPSMKAAQIDGIAMSPDFHYVYYCPLGDNNLYQIPTSTLRDHIPGNKSGLRLLGRKVSRSDGLAHGNAHLYFGALGFNAVYYWDVAADLDNQNASMDTVTLTTQKELVKDDETMQWPDTFAFDNEGWLWFVSNRLQLFNKGQMDFTGVGGPNMRVWKVYVNETGYLYKANERTQAGTIVG